MIPLAERGLAPDRRPLVVAVDADGYAAALAELSGAGWTIVEGGAPERAGTCLQFSVRNRDAAQAVLVAALRGVAMLAVLRPGQDVDPDLEAIAADLIEDLAGLGVTLQIDATNAVVLEADSWRLAHEIARGTTLESAARELHMSTRTANRRLTTARKALGADSRAQLVRILTSPERVPAAVSGR